MKIAYSIMTALALLMASCGDKDSPQKAPESSSSATPVSKTGGSQTVNNKQDESPQSNSLPPDDPVTKVERQAAPTRPSITAANTPRVPLPTPVTEAQLAIGPDKDARFAKDSVAAGNGPLKDPKSKESQALMNELVTKGNAAAKIQAK